MLTSFWVRCPHAGCQWSGNLLPREEKQVLAAAVPSKKIVKFTCPRCQGEFLGRVKGDDVIPLPLEEPVTVG
jgi:hypothetical protein